MYTAAHHAQYKSNKLNVRYIKHDDAASTPKIVKDQSGDYAATHVGK
jgi:hypothetical protein